MMHKKVIKFDSIKLEKFRNTDLSTNNYNEIIMYIVQLSKSYKFTFFSFDRQKFNNNKIYSADTDYIYTYGSIKRESVFILIIWKDIIKHLLLITAYSVKSRKSPQNLNSRMKTNL